MTIRTDCELDGHVSGLPSLEGIAIGPQQIEELKGFYEKYGFKSLVKTLEAHEVAPELIEENKKQKGPEGGTGLFDEPPGLEAAAKASNLAYDTVMTWERSMPGSRSSRRPSWLRSTPRPPRSTRCARRSWASASA